jgi:hypothetical protein
MEMLIPSELLPYLQLVVFEFVYLRHSVSV